MRPPLFWQLVNALREWSERDERLLVEHWKAAFAPAPREKKAIPFRNLLVYRSEKRRVA